MHGTTARPHPESIAMNETSKSPHRFSFGLFAAAILGLGSIDLSAQINPSITNLVNQGLTSAIGWQGGTGIFVLQKKYDLSDPSWINVLTTSNRDFVIPQESDAAFFRLQSQATNTVLAFTAFLTGPSEVPAVSSSATGIAAFSLEGSNLSYYVRFSGLSGAATL